jgi:hypothetical protein
MPARAPARDVMFLPAYLSSLFKIDSINTHRRLHFRSEIVSHAIFFCDGYLLFPEDKFSGSHTLISSTCHSRNERARALPNAFRVLELVIFLAIQLTCEACLSCATHHCNDD